jgi:YD repeat-containing protein
MNTFSKASLSLLLNFSLFANQVLANLPPISFESPVFVPWEPVSNRSGEGWTQMSGTAHVSASGEGFGGGQGLKLPGNATESWVKKEISWKPAERTAFIDLQIKPAAEPDGSFASIVTNGSQVAFQVPRGGTTGQLWVLHGGDGTNGVSQWYQTQGSYTVTPGTNVSSSWTRVTLRHDYDRNLWDLFIDGKLAAVNLAFEGRGENLASLDLFGSRHGDTMVDDISAQPSNMLFPDADKDGLPDSWESTNGSNPNLYDRDAIKSGTGKSFLDLYLAMLWPTGGSASNGIAGIGGIGTIPPLTILGKHKPVGALKGSFSVGGDGSSAYSIPIDLPKGTAGMEPKISIGYSSGTGNGLAGLGWGINGFQKITRGPATVAKDGKYDPIDFDQDDRFYMDGERLVCVAGTYGSDASEYRTEIDSFARITAIGDGPVSWKVETKAGLIVYLGETADSKQQISKGTLTWGVNRVLDTVGNFYSVDYTRDANGGQPFDFINDRITAVHYTGNTAKGASPYSHVYFDYEDRPDKSRAYTTHAGYQVTKRLSKIRVTTDGYTNHSYKFGYTNSWQTGRSLLTSASKFAEDDPAKSISPTTFKYDGLKEGEPIWADSGSVRLVNYGKAIDASGGTGSVVNAEADGRTIHLTGDVSKAYSIPGGVTVEADSILEFDFKSDRQSLGALVGLDANNQLEMEITNVKQIQNGGPPTPLFRVGGTGDLKLNGILKLSGNEKDDFTFSFKGPVQAYDQGQGWKTFRLGLAQFGTGLRNHLILANVDRSMADEADEAIFRNVKIYRSGSENPSNAEPIRFEIGPITPRLRESSGKDRGISVLDLNGDGLPDIADWHVNDYAVAGGTIVPKTEGEAYINTGRGFRLDPSLLPPTTVPVGVRAAAAAEEWNRRHNLIAQPTDIDGDGNLDLCAPIFTNPAGIPKSALRNEVGFYSRSSGGWKEMTEWKLPFLCESSAVSGYWGGDRRFNHFQWADLNGDGYQDLLIHTTAVGRLRDRFNHQIILEGNSSAAFLNKGRDGAGWIRDDSYAAPEMLLGVKDYGPKDIGRKLLDLNGDGRLEIVEAWQLGAGGPGKETKRTYFYAESGAYRWNSTPGRANPPVSPYDLPATFIDSSAIDRSGLLVLDANGDGLPDILQHVHGGGIGSAVVNSWINQGSRSATPWVKEGIVGATSYQLPMAMHYPVIWGDPSQPRIPMGFEIADVNGDGLTDIFYSNEDNFGMSGSGNFVLANTGDGWSKRLGWGAPGTIRITSGSNQREGGIRQASLMDLDGDGFPDLVSNLLEVQPRIWRNQCRPEVLISVTDGFGSEIQAEYRRLNDPSPTTGFGTRVYEKGTGVLPPGQSAVIDSRLVVSRYSEPDGMNGRRYKSQRYGDLRQDRHNETVLGFGWVEVLDELNGQRQRTETMRQHPFAGSPILSETYVLVSPADVGGGSVYPGVTAGLKLVTQEVSEYAELPSQTGIGGTIRRPVQTRATKHTFDLDGTLKIGTVTTQTVGDFDEFGFVKKSMVKSLDDSTVVTESVYQHVTDAARWHLGRLSESNVTKSIGGEVSVKTATFGYSPTNGLLIRETVQPGHPLSVTKSYGHDDFGNIVSTSVSAQSKARVSTTQFDPKGRFPVGTANALGHLSTSSYDFQRALLLSITDIGGRTTWLHYDAFGTLIRTDHPGGTQSAEITGLATNASVPASVSSLISGSIKYFRAKEISGAPPAVVYLDAMGRELVGETTILRDAEATGASRYSKVYVVNQYDWRGRKIGTSNPFAAGETPAFTFVSYDLLDRNLVTIYPDGGVERVQTYGIAVLDNQPVTYSKVLNKNGKTLERWEDQHGRFVQSRDPSGQLTRFTYDAESRMTAVSVAGQTLLTNTFDLFGNKTEVWEANSGRSSSNYNGFGEVESVTNARGDVTGFEYDILGRKTKVSKPEGTYYTQYDQARGNGIGQPWKTTGPSGYVEEVSYDSLGRPSATAKNSIR